MAEALYDAAIEGNVSLEALLRNNPNLLNTVSFACSNRTPLHVATMQGNTNIVRSMLSINPKLAEELDSQKSSPLHIAAANGYARIAAILKSVAPNMCWSRDCHGMNPIHIAAMNGHVDTLETLVGVLDPPIPAAREKLGRGDTVLHLCVKHNQLDALKFLAGKLGTDLVAKGNEDGDTVLHLAVRYKQFQIVDYLVEETNSIDKKLRNGKGETAFEILIQIDPDPASNSDTKKMLKCEEEVSKDALIRLGDVIMVVVILIAAMAFQSMISPPGGVWQLQDDYKAGKAVMGFTHPNIFKLLNVANMIAFFSSMMAILLLTTRFPSTNQFVLVFTACMTWVSVAAISVSFGASELVLAPHNQPPSFGHVATFVSCMILIPLGISTIWVLLSSPPITQTFNIKVLEAFRRCRQYLVG